MSPRHRQVLAAIAAIACTACTQTAAGPDPRPVQATPQQARIAPTAPTPVTTVDAEAKFKSLSDIADDCSWGVFRAQINGWTRTASNLAYTMFDDCREKWFASAVALTKYSRAHGDDRTEIALAISHFKDIKEGRVVGWTEIISSAMARKRSAPPSAPPAPPPSQPPKWEQRI